MSESSREDQAAGRPGAEPAAGASAGGSPGPERRSMRDRLVPPPRRPVNPLTDTTMTSISGLDTLNTAFRVRHDGGVVADQSAAPIAAPLRRMDQESVIDLDEALSHHLLLVSDEVDADELEALAVSVWDESGWAGPGMLRLGGGAALRGPWAIDAQSRRALGASAALTHAWLVVCPPSRGAAPDPGLMARDPWAHAFPDGMPVGVELRILLTLRRMARRLCGALRIQGTGDILAPDPDSAVNLTAYSPRWIGPEELLAVLRAEFPTVIDSRDVPLAPQPHPDAREVERIQTIAQSVAELPEDVAHHLEESRRRAQSEPQTVDAYAAVAPAGNRSELMVEVRVVPRPPQVLRWEAWTDNAIVEYRVRWLPGPGIDVTTERLSRTSRLERLRAARDVERAAGLVVDAVGGSVIDEDGFLVGQDGDPLAGAPVR